MDTVNTGSKGLQMKRKRRGWALLGLRIWDLVSLIFDFYVAKRQHTLGFSLLSHSASSVERTYVILDITAFHTCFIVSKMEDVKSNRVVTKLEV